MAANGTTVAPSTGVPGLIAPLNASDALFGLCGWTAEDPVCYVTVIPIALCLVMLLAVLARQLAITPQHSALQATIQPKDSPLLPPSFRYFEAGELNQVISGVSDMPLKTFLPRVGMAELVEPSAALGIANVKDLLRANRLALRDIGIGPRETRLFSRALERRVRLREKMQDVFLSTSSKYQARRQRAPTLTQRSREAVARSLRARRAAAASESGAANANGHGANAVPTLARAGSEVGAGARGDRSETPERPGSGTPTAGANTTPFGVFSGAPLTTSFSESDAAQPAGGSFGAWSGRRASAVPGSAGGASAASAPAGGRGGRSSAPAPLQQYGATLVVPTPRSTPGQHPTDLPPLAVPAGAATTSRPPRPPPTPDNASFSRDRQDTLPPPPVPVLELPPAGDGDGGNANDDGAARAE